MEKDAFLQESCEIIAGLFNVVITIVDKKFIRIAGTDRYKAMIGQKSLNPHVFREAIENNRMIIITNPREDPICQYCSDINNCSEQSAIYMPLRVNKKIIGGIGIIAFTDEQKKSGLFNDKTFLQFAEKFSELLSSKLEAQEYAYKLNIQLKENIAILDSVHDAVIAVNSKNKIYQINRAAEDLYGIDKTTFLNSDINTILSDNVLSKLNIDDTLIDVEDKIQVKNKPYNVLITASKIIQKDKRCGAVFSFKSMKEAKHLAKKMIHGSDYTVDFDDIIGNSEKIDYIKTIAKKISNSASTVLIRGESGTGKEMFARAIHKNSSRANGPFVAINCAAIPEPLLESELFGYEEGAFTGAKKGGKIGKCELASGGTLFLDEVGDIPIFLQVKFLRMLQERRIERVGGNNTIPVDIRIIAATNRNLEEMIEKNEYREDLYYRLNVIQLELPPLRERKGDIEIVSKFFLEKYSNKLSKEIVNISNQALYELEKYSWPGNLRELENVIECAVNIENDSILQAASLPDRIKNGERGNIIEEKVEVEIQKSTSKHKVSIDEIINELDKYGWDTKGKKIAAKKLNIGIATLYRILNNRKK